ncbi:hypothetical protein ABZ858_31975 [Streptomyces sp. NPDC047017]|uniref:hypothetical protein n=1 Tax=Streptomyces sp. NPDC047017 TaxID=3155024 RepID=UPI0033E9A321
MTTHPEQGHGLVPRPERTPEAVRVALARVAPHRLGEREQHQGQALATAIQDGRIGHLQHWLTHGQVQVEIERRPDLHARHHAALAAVNESGGKDAPEFRAAMDELHAVETEARQSAPRAL